MELYVSVKVNGTRYKFRQQLTKSRVPKGHPEQLAWIKTLIGAAGTEINNQMKEEQKAKSSTSN